MVVLIGIVSAQQPFGRSRTVWSLEKRFNLTTPHTANHELSLRGHARRHQEKGGCVYEGERSFYRII